MLGIAKKIFGTENDRTLKKLRPLVEKINGLEPKFEAMTDDALRAHFSNFAAVKCDPANELHIIMPLTQSPLCRFTDGRECLGQKIIERLSSF